MDNSFKDGDKLEVIDLPTRPKGIFLNGSPATHVDIKAMLFRSTHSGIVVDMDIRLEADGSSRVLCYYIRPKQGEKHVAKEMNFMDMIQAYQTLEHEASEKANTPTG